MAKHSFYIGEIEITPREILFSVIILSFMVGIGVWLSNPILKKVNEDALNIESCVKVNDAEKFGYIKRTNAGGFLAEGTLTAIDSVSIPDIGGFYSAIVKDTERYTMHVQTYTTTDGKGRSQVHTRTYWTWDVIRTEKWASNYVSFLGETFKITDLKYRWNTSYKETIKKSSDVRYVYYTHPTAIQGLIRGVADDKSFEQLSFKENSTITATVENAERKIRNSPIIFFVLWSIFSIFAVAAFYVAQNEWLED